MYAALKHFHLMTIALSAGFFITQYILMVSKSSWSNKPLFKIAPHVVNGVLILSGIALLFVAGWVPFTPGAEWLTEKFTAVLAYIALSVFTLRLAKNPLLRAFGFLGALGWLLMASKIGLAKMPIFMG
jgi:uncharacterized membrane protein SirB2